MPLAPEGPRPRFTYHTEWCCQQLLVLLPASWHWQGSDCWSHQPFLLGSRGGQVLPSPAPCPRELGCSGGCRQVATVLRAPNSSSSYKG